MTPVNGGAAVDALLDATPDIRVVAEADSAEAAYLQLEAARQLTYAAAALGVGIAFVVLSLLWGRLFDGFEPDRLAIGMDWMATFLAAAGVAPDPGYPLDGIDLFGDPVDRALFWRMKFRDQKAARRGDWKWLSIEGNEFLFDLATDQRERANKRYLEPDRFRVLRDEYLDWERTVPPIPDDATVDLAYTDAEIAHAW